MPMLCSSVLFVILKAKSSYIDQLPIPIGVLSCGSFEEPWRPPLPPFPTPENRTLQKVIVKSDDPQEYNVLPILFFKIMNALLKLLQSIKGQLSNNEITSNL